MAGNNSSETRDHIRHEPDVDGVVKTERKTVFDW